MKPTLIIAAMIFVVTCAGKFVMLATDPFPEITAGMPIPLIWSAIFVELFAIWLMFTKNLEHAVKWMLLLAIFIVFLFVSASRYLIGFESCGCAGVIHIPPLVSVFGNLSFIALLIYFRPVSDKRTLGLLGLQVRSTPPETWATMAGVFACCILFVASQSNWARTYLQSFGTAATIESGATLVGNMPKNMPVNATATLTNLSDKPATIVGFEKSCTCMHLDPARTVISPGETISLRVVLRARKEGRFWQRARYYVDCSRKQEVVTVDFLGFVKGD